MEDLIPWHSQETIRAFVEAGYMGRDLAVEAGHTIYVPTAEELESWIETLKPLQETWVKDREAEGKPGREMLDEMLRIAREHYDR
jgi:hypothetical protein